MQQNKGNNTGIWLTAGVHLLLAAVLLLTGLKYVPYLPDNRLEIEFEQEEERQPLPLKIIAEQGSEPRSPQPVSERPPNWYNRLSSRKRLRELSVPGKTPRQKQAMLRFPTPNRLLSMKGLCTEAATQTQRKLNKQACLPERNARQEIPPGTHRQETLWDNPLPSWPDGL